MMKNQLKTMAVSAIPAALLLSGCSITDHHEQKKYNVLMIIVDDMNDYGFYETYPGNVKMPYIDRFKESALTFRHAYCSSPVCTPSRASFYSGLYPHTTGVYHNATDPFNTSDILKHTETLPELMRRNGYYSFGLGKLYHAPMPDDRIRQNFDNDTWGKASRLPRGFYPFPDSINQVNGIFWGMQAFPDSLFPDVINSDEVIDFLSQDHEAPFFISFGLWRPHTPFTAPQRFFDMYDIDKIQLPPGYKEDDLDDIGEAAKKLLDPFGLFNPDDEDEWKAFIHGYLACTSFADWTAGRVIEALDNSPYADNTIVIFFSDNGYHCGEKDHWQKNTLWEQSALVPAAIRIPDSRHNGKISTRPVNLIDIYPTLVDYCGLKPPAHQLDGLSLRPLLQNPHATWDRPSLTTFGEYFATVRDERYRYIIYGDGSEELYDHKNDPYEWYNLIDDTRKSNTIDKLKKHIPDEFAKTIPGVWF